MQKGFQAHVGMEIKYSHMYLFSCMQEHVPPPLIYFCVDRQHTFGRGREMFLLLNVINPRRACAARVTVCVCVCVCVSVTQHLTFHVIIRATKDTNPLSGI